MHLHLPYECREGIYHIRIYSLPERSLRSQNAFGRTGDLAHHYRYITTENSSVVEIDEALIAEVGSFRVGIDGEFAMGIPDFGTWKLTLRSHKIFEELIAEIRDLRREVWAEVVLEQRATDVPKLGGDHFLAARKTRSIFWGKLLRHDTRGKAPVQLMISEGDSRLTRTFGTPPHLGTIELTFAHWFNVNGAEPVEDLLDTFRIPFAAFADAKFSIGVLLNTLIEQVSPVKMKFIADHRSIVEDGFGDAPNALSRCNIELKRIYRSASLQTQQLFQLESDARKNSLWSPLLHKRRDYGNNDTSNGEFSFYNWKDLRQAIFELTREFFLTFQIELPTMEDAFKMCILPRTPANTSWNRSNYPESCMRWLFIEGQWGKKISIMPRRDTIEYTPAATWLKKVTVTEPAPQNESSGGWHYEPSPNNKVWLNKFEGGQDVAYRTLFRFAGYVQKFGAGGWNWVREPLGYDLTIRIAGNVPEEELVDEVEYLEDTEHIIDHRWATAHMRYIAGRWGAAKAMLKVESKGVGIEPFGSSQKNKPKILGTFGQYDWAEFPLLREITAAPGVLGTPKVPATFALIEIERKPGEHSKLTFLELTDPVPFSEALYLPPITDPPPPPPPHNDPPVISFDPRSPIIFGTVMLAMTATDDIAVSHIRMYLDGTYIGLATHVSSSAWQYSFNSTLYANGSHTLQCVAHDSEGATADHYLSITIIN